MKTFSGKIITYYFFFENILFGIKIFHLIRAFESKALNNFLRLNRFIIVFIIQNNNLIFMFC